MKVATFNRAMAPHVAGESRVVSDELAATLSKDGAADISDFPPADVAPPKGGTYRTRMQVPAKRKTGRNP